LKKILCLTLVLMLACTASIVLLTGCGGDKDGATAERAEDGTSENGGEVSTEKESGGESTELTDEGGRKITVEEPQEEGESGKVTLEEEGGEQSTIEVQEQAPSEDALGAPVYPGAKYIEGSGVSGTTTSGDQQLAVAGAEFTTTDAIAKVVSWYESKIGAPMASAAEATTWMLQEQEGTVVTVVVELYENQVKITIAKVSGDIDIGP